MQLLCYDCVPLACLLYSSITTLTSAILPKLMSCSETWKSVIWNESVCSISVKSASESVRHTLWPKINVKSVVQAFSNRSNA